MPKVAGDPRAAFMSKVVLSKNCWNWTGGLGSSSRRPMFRNQYSHRWLYQEVGGCIPDGMELDHTCKNTLCVRPDHMEPVTRAVNMERARLGRCRADKHDLTDPRNQHFDKHGRRRGCRGCLNDRAREYYHARKG